MEIDNLYLNEINAYTKIALENRDLAHTYQQNANSAKSITEYGKLILESRQYAIVSIIFSAFTLEAYINDGSCVEEVRFASPTLEGVSYAGVGGRSLTSAHSLQMSL